MGFVGGSVAIRERDEDSVVRKAGSIKRVFRGFGVELLLLSNPLRPPKIVYILRKIGEVNEGKKKLVTGRSRKTHTFDRFSQGSASLYSTVLSSLPSPCS